MELNRLPSLKSLQAFEATARLRSFSRAAAELCVSQSAISHQVSKLEQELGCALLIRRPLPLSLTQQGDSLFSVLSDGFFRFQRVCQHLQQQQSRALRIVAQTSIAVEWLAPRLALFSQQQPHIQTMLHMESNASSLEPEQADLIIGTWPCPAGFSSQSLRAEWWFPVCAPAQYQQLQLDDPKSVFDFPLYSSEQGEDWQLWAQQFQLRAPACRDLRQVSLALLATKAVSSGHGLALSNSFIAGDAVRAGQLKALTAWRYQLPWGQYQVHFRQGSLEQAAIEVFIGWLMQQAAVTMLPLAPWAAPNANISVNINNYAVSGVSPR